MPLVLDVGALVEAARGSRASDVVDASVVLLAGHGDEILTGDASDLALLAQAAGLQVDVVPV